MKIERTKNATRNIAFGFILKIYHLSIPFVMRTTMIYLLGVEYLGLNSLFVSILQVLNLAELGIGSAMTFSMYKPIADDDEIKICALMNLYRTYYRFIGAVILIGGVAIVPFLNHLISADVPSGINIYILYLLNLSATVFTYWLFAYRNSIFNAYQRTDVISKITIVTDTIKYGIQIFVLAVFHNYYLYVIAILVSQILNNVTIAIMSKKMYPQYAPQGDISKEEKRIINKKILDLFTSKLGGTLVGSTDTIIISAFMGLKVLAIYQNYYYVMEALSGILIILFNSVTAGSGNSMVTETRDKNYCDFKRLSWITYWIGGFSICGLFCLYQTLMKIWVGPELMLPNSFVPLLCLYLLGNITIQFLSVYKNAAGIWHEDRFRPLVAGLINLGLNIILVNWIGLYGILVATIISRYFISIPWLTKNVFTLVFPGKFKDYFFDLIKYLIGIITATIITYAVCSFIIDQGIIILFVKTIICTVVCNSLFVVFYFKSPIFKDILAIGKRLIKK